MIFSVSHHRSPGETPRTIGSGTLQACPRPELALHSSCLGTALDDESLKVAEVLRLGGKVSKAHRGSNLCSWAPWAKLR